MKRFVLVGLALCVALVSHEARAGTTCIVQVKARNSAPSGSVKIQRLYAKVEGGYYDQKPPELPHVVIPTNGGVASVNEAGWGINFTSSCDNNHRVKVELLRGTVAKTVELPSATTWFKSSQFSQTTASGSDTTITWTLDLGDLYRFF